VIALAAEPQEPTLANTARVGHPSLLVGEKFKNWKIPELGKERAGLKGV
jgi:hypothetical protein